MNIHQEITNLSDWILRKISTNEYGEIQVTLKMTKGRPILLQKAFFEKSQIKNPNTGITGGFNCEKSNL